MKHTKSWILKFLRKELEKQTDTHTLDTELLKEIYILLTRPYQVCVEDILKGSDS